MSCKQCRIGQYQPTRSTYHTWLNAQFITVPDAPAYVCDVCGHMYYDTHFVQRMDSILDDFALMERPSNTKPMPTTAVPTSSDYVGTSRRSG
ncbi:MAG: hypothetical protein Kow0080_23780 [Candidatus Promineifilaceae bacterium]